jgi:hypothetical protein
MAPHDNCVSFGAAFLTARRGLAEATFSRGTFRAAAGAFFFTPVFPILLAVIPNPGRP